MGIMTFIGKGYLPAPEKGVATMNRQGRPLAYVPGAAGAAVVSLGMGSALKGA